MKKSNTTDRAQGKSKGFTKKISSLPMMCRFINSRQSRESMNDKILRLIENDMQGRKIAEYLGIFRYFALCRIFPKLVEI